MLAMYEQGFTKPFELELIHKDGTHFPVVINSVRIRDVEGKDFHYTLVEDITERKRIEQKLLEAKKQAEELSALKTHFISTISHELRTPMAIIIGYAEIARVREPNLSTAPLLEKIEGAAKNLLALLNDILDFSKLQAKQDQFEAAEFDLQLLLNNLKNDFSIAAEKKELLFTVEQSSALPNAKVPNTLIGDADKLKRVFINLIGNALKFTHAGSVTLSVKLNQLSSSHALLDFSVRDTGIGIAEKDHDKLFKLFSQVDSSDNRQYEGTGLGLAISDELVHIMGGKISVDSRVGEGSTFSFSLNIELPKTVVNQPNSTLTTPALEHYQRTWQSNKRLLLVEDNEMLQELIVDYLTPIGISVDLARHGKEALAKLAHNDYDLILMDVQMPVMNGIETTEHLRSQARYATLPIIGFTARLTEPEKEQYLASGMTDLIPKPIDTEQFFSTLKKWLGE
jgi:signal transduction histidine kinase/BarA-like signal transduction histidine kinase